ncbi:hypothetical protein QTP86_011132 [Hemibagrus guttatus]|nr:hypothetical protein QTP86_011132 [Hemibagrus guttatus]
MKKQIPAVALGCRGGPPMRHGDGHFVLHAGVAGVDDARRGIPSRFSSGGKEWIAAVCRTSINFFSNLNNSSSSVGSDHTGRPSLPTCITSCEISDV